MGQETSEAAQHQASYERIYQTTGLHDDARFYEWVLRLIKPRVGSRLLDVACGEGGLLVAASRLPVRVYSVGISYHTLLKVRAKDSTADVIIGNTQQLPFPSQSFDSVTCLGSLENFTEPLHALDEIWRILKPGGVLCIMLPNKFWLGDALQVLFGKEEQQPFQRVERMATVGQWRRLLQLQGFSVQRMIGYVKCSPLIKEGKLRSVRKFLRSQMLSMLCPVSLAWSVMYLCQRSSPRQSSQSGAAAWIWRAEWARPGSASLS